MEKIRFGEYIKKFKYKNKYGLKPQKIAINWENFFYYFWYKLPKTDIKNNIIDISEVYYFDPDGMALLLLLGKYILEKYNFKPYLDLPKFTEKTRQDLISNNFMKYLSDYFTTSYRFDKVYDGLFKLRYLEASDKYLFDSFDEFDISNINNDLNILINNYLKINRIDEKSFKIVPFLEIIEEITLNVIKHSHISGEDMLGEGIFIAQAMPKGYDVIKIFVGDIGIGLMDRLKIVIKEKGLKIRNPKNDIEAIKLALELRKKIIKEPTSKGLPYVIDTTKLFNGKFRIRSYKAEGILDFTKSKPSKKYFFNKFSFPGTQILIEIPIQK